MHGSVKRDTGGAPGQVAGCGVRMKTHVKAGDMPNNHNKAVSPAKAAPGVKIGSRIKAGRIGANHVKAVSGLKVRTHVKAGHIMPNHNKVVTRTGGG